MNPHSVLLGYAFLASERGHHTEGSSSSHSPWHPPSRVPAARAPPRARRDWVGSAYSRHPSSEYRSGTATTTTTLYYPLTAIKVPTARRKRMLCAAQTVLVQHSKGTPTRFAADCASHDEQLRHGLQHRDAGHAGEAARQLRASSGGGGHGLGSAGAVPSTQCVSRPAALSGCAGSNSHAGLHRCFARDEGAPIRRDVRRPAPQPPAADGVQGAAPRARRQVHLP